MSAKLKEIELYEARLDNFVYKMYYGVRTLKLALDGSYCIYEKTKRPLEFISFVKFGIPEKSVNLAGRDITRRFIYRTEMNDLTVIYKYINGNFVFDHVEFMNIEFYQK